MRVHLSRSIAVLVGCLVSQQALADCISYDGRGNFESRCSTTKEVRFVTVGGCYENGAGELTINAGGRVHTGAAQSCNGSPSRIQWWDCDYDSYIDGSCKLPR